MAERDIDRKFQIQALNPTNGKRYTEADSLLLCAKDAAVPAALNAYIDECVRIGANLAHIESAGLLLERVLNFQVAAGGGRVPDTITAEIPRCINGEGLANIAVTDGGYSKKMDFGTALDVLKGGRPVARAGWNGKGMFVVYQKGYPQGIACNKQTAEAWGLKEGDLFRCEPYLQIQMVNGSHAMWVPSINDVLAEDWTIYEAYVPNDHL